MLVHNERVKYHCIIDWNIPENEIRKFLNYDHESINLLVAGLDLEPNFDISLNRDNWWVDVAWYVKFVQKQDQSKYLIMKITKDFPWRMYEMKKQEEWCRSKTGSSHCDNSPKYSISFDEWLKYMEEQKKDPQEIRKEEERINYARGRLMSLGLLSPTKTTHRQERIQKY